MRALTVRQPWAFAIVHGGKDVENRTRNIAGDYRGPVAIHAGKAEDFPATHPTGSWTGQPEESWLARGAIIGVATLTDVHPPDTRTDISHSVAGACSPWAVDGQHHLVLANPRPLATPIPARGYLGLWYPSTGLADLIRAQLEAVSV